MSKKVRKVGRSLQPNFIKDHHLWFQEWLVKYHSDSPIVQKVINDAHEYLNNYEYLFDDLDLILRNGRYVKREIFHTEAFEDAINDNLEALTEFSTQFEQEWADYILPCFRSYGVNLIAPFDFDEVRGVLQSWLSSLDDEARRKYNVRLYDDRTEELDGTQFSFGWHGPHIRFDFVNDPQPPCKRCEIGDLQIYNFHSDIKKREIGNSCELLDVVASRDEHVTRLLKALSVFKNFWFIESPGYPVSDEDDEVFLTLVDIETGARKDLFTAKPSIASEINHED